MCFAYACITGFFLFSFYPQSKSKLDFALLCGLPADEESESDGSESLSDAGEDGGTTCSSYFCTFSTYAVFIMIMVLIFPHFN